MQGCKLTPPILVLRNSVFNPLQLVSHGTEAMDFGGERGVVEATNHSVRLVLSFRPLLERLQLLGSVRGLPIVMEDGRDVQGFCIHLVAIVAQPNDDGVGVEYDLHILRLSDVAIWPFDGVGDEVTPAVGCEPEWDFIPLGSVASLVQREASGGGRVGGFVRLISVSERAYKWVLSWVEVALTHVAVGVTPRAARCRCTVWCSASRAAIFAFLLAAALVNCSSLHVEQTFCSAVCDALGFFEGDWQWDLAWMTIFRSPNVGIDVLHVGLVGRGCSHVVRV